jgi:hypothetical protein
MKKIHYILFFLLCQLSQLNAQDFRFALITDTHIADNTSAAEDLKNSIEQQEYYNPTCSNRFRTP